MARYPVTVDFSPIVLPAIISTDASKTKTLSTQSEPQGVAMSLDAERSWFLYEDATPYTLPVHRTAIAQRYASWVMGGLKVFQGSECEEQETDSQ